MVEIISRENILPRHPKRLKGETSGGKDMPPLKVVQCEDTGKCIIVDGHHRYFFNPATEFGVTVFGTQPTTIIKEELGEELGVIDWDNVVKNG